MIPTTRVPMMAIEFDPSRAFEGPGLLRYAFLCVGQKNASGASATAETFYKVTESDPDTFFGPGSDLARMLNSWFRGNKYTDIFAYAYEDPGSSAKATCAITITGPATASGEVSLLINGKRVATAVAATQIATAIATAMAAAINADTSLPVTAAVGGGGSEHIVTLTCKNGGVVGNSIDVQHSYYDGEVLPAGVGVSIAAEGMAGGTGNIDLATVIAALGDDWFQGIVCSATDATNLALIEVELDTRFGPMVMKDGVYFISVREADRTKTKSGQLQDLITFGASRNSKHVTCLNGIRVPNSPPELAAAYAAQIAKEGSIDPARPFQTLELVGILPPRHGFRNTIADNDSLLWKGISTFDIVAGKVQIQRAITMYQLSPAGVADVAYLDLNTMLTLMYIRFDFRTTIRRKYPRAKLADDGVRVRAGMQVMTPSMGKAEAVAIFRSWEYEGLVEGVDTFKEGLLCQRSISDPNRLEWTLTPDLMNQFRVGAVTIQFLLQSLSL